MAEVTVKVSEDGPYLVKGPVKVVDADGNQYDNGNRPVLELCRCGGSATKPFCDGTHRRVDFVAAERAPRGEA
jgi:CDGSH iron-sulfur domain-containing protein 3